MKTQFTLGQNETISDICCHEIHRCWALSVTFVFLFPSPTSCKWLLLPLFYMERLREVKQLAQGPSARAGIESVPTDLQACAFHTALQTVHIYSEAKSRGTTTKPILPALATHGEHTECRLLWWNSVRVLKG